MIQYKICTCYNKCHDFNCPLLNSLTKDCVYNRNFEALCENAPYTPEEIKQIKEKKYNERILKEYEEALDKVVLLDYKKDSIHQEDFMKCYEKILNEYSIKYPDVLFADERLRYYWMGRTVGLIIAMEEF